MKYLFSILFVLLFAYANASDTTTVSIQVGAGSKFGAINIKDNVTGNYVASTITNLSVQNNNADLATVTIYNDAVKITGLKAGSGTAVVSCHLNYTDPGDGQQKSEDKSIVVSYTVTAAPHGVSIVMTF